MITPSFSLAATERVLPRLALDFTTTVLDPRVTFTRSTTGRFYNATSTAIAEQNLLTYSQQFDQWTAASGPNTVSSDVLSPLAPDGTATADKIIPTTSNFGFRIRQSNAVTTTGTSLLSVYVQDGGYGFLVAVVTGAIGRATINFATGAITNYGTNSFTLVSSVNVIGSWYRVVLSIPVSIPGFRVWLGVTNLMQDPLTAFTGDGTSGIFIWGAQLENRSAVSAYTATTTTAITNTIPALQTAAIDAPRFDHNPITRASLGLLIEEARTNILLQSEDLDTTWAETRATLALNSYVSPSGTLTADTLIASTDNDTHFTTQTFTGTAVAHTYSVYAKSSGLSHVALRLFNGTSEVGLAYYNLSTGAVGTVTAGTASIQSVGNGFYRCVLTATLAASASCTAGIYLANADNTNSFAGNAFNGVALWGAQLEVGAFQTSYIPTVASTVLRNADIATMTGTNFSDWYNASEGALVFNADAVTSGAQRTLIILRDTVTNSSHEFLFLSGSYLYRIRTNGTIEAQISRSPTNKCVGTYKLNDAAFAANPSTTVNTDNSCTMPTGIFELLIGSINGNVRGISYYPQRLLNAEIVALTR
jgi:hypothetical protein